MIKIDCYCLFDITTTGVSNQQRNTEFPFHTRYGQTVSDMQMLSKARNQQRNYDTLLQLIGMRTQMFEITPAALANADRPVFQEHDMVWYFSFAIEPEAQWLVDGDEFWILKNDSEGTPMLVGLDERSGLDPWIVTQGPKTNTIYVKR